MAEEYIHVYGLEKSGIMLSSFSGEASISRKRLFRKLHEATDKKLTLLSAPKGYGKTGLLKQFVDQNQKTPENCQESTHAPVKVFVSLDKFDNDPYRLVAKLIGALDAKLELCGEGRLYDSKTRLENIRNLGTCSLESLEKWLVDAFNAVFVKSSHSSELCLEETKISLKSKRQEDIDNFPPPTALVVLFDNYECLSFSGAREVIVSLIAYSVPGIHVLIASDEKIDSFRFVDSVDRAIDKYTLLGANDLSFLQEEIEALIVESMGTQKDDVYSAAQYAILIKEITEGWPYGVKCLIKELQRDCFSEASFSLERLVSLVDDYFTSEVFKKQSEEDWNFLVEASLFETIEAPLCEVALDYPKSALKLRQLADTLGFLIPLDSVNQGFRLHSMFRKWLNSKQKESISHERIRKIFTKASEWYEQKGHHSAAARSVFFASDTENILRLSEWAFKSDSFEGKENSVQEIAELPALEPCLKPHLCLISAWAYASQKRSDAVMMWLEKLTTAMQQKNCTEDQITRIGRVREVLLAICCSLNNKHDEGIQRCHILLETLKEESDTALLKAYLSYQLAESYERKGDFNRAIRYQTEAIEFSRDANFDLVFLHASYELARLLFFCGQLNAAEKSLSQTLSNISQNHSISYARLAQIGRIQLERLELAPVKQNIEKALQGLSAMHRGDLYADALLAKAEYLVFVNKYVEASHVVAKVFALAEKAYVPRKVLVLALIKEAELDLLFDKIADARKKYSCLMAEIDSEDLILTTTLRILHATLLRKEGKLQEALELFGEIVRILEDKELKFLLIKSLIGMATLFKETGKHAKASVVLGQALSLSFPEQIGSPFLLERNSAIHTMLLERLSTGYIASDKRLYLRHLLDTFNYHKKAKTVSLNDCPKALTDVSLTKKEFEILGLLKQGLNNKEISESVSISLNTVKTHVARIYSKFNVHNKVELLRVVEGQKEC